MTSEPPGHLRRYTAIVLQGHIKELRRNGYPAPAGLEAYIDRLLAPESDMLTRRRYLNRQYQRRSRANKKAQRAA